MEQKTAEPIQLRVSLRYLGLDGYGLLIQPFTGMVTGFASLNVN